jgi:hypothetical protein
MDAEGLIKSALRFIGVLASGEEPSDAELDDGLVVLNQMILNWSAQGLPIYQITRATQTLNGAATYTLSTRPVKIKAASVIVTSGVNTPMLVANPLQWAEYAEKGYTADRSEILFYEDGYPLGKIHVAPLVSGTIEVIGEKAIGGGTMMVRDTITANAAASYTIGAGGTVDVERFVRIHSASILASSTVAQEAKIVTAEGYAAYPRRGAGKFADVLYWDAALSGNSYMLAPNPAAGTLEIFVYNALGTLAALDTTVTLPPGYELALRNALGVLLAPEYGRPVDATTAQLAEDAKMSIFGLNSSVLGPPQPATAASAPPPPPPVPPQPQE